MTPQISNNAKWQIVFLASFASLIILGSLAFGSARVLAVAAILGICVAALNALLQRSSTDTQPVASYARKALNVSRLLKSTTVIMISADIVLACVIGVALLRAMQAVLVSGTITSALNEALPEVTVTLKLGNQEITTTTDEKGHFSITTFGVTRSARLEVHYQNVHLDKDLRDFKNLADIQLQLPPGTGPFRLSYYRLGGHTFGLIKHGSMPPTLLAGFSAAPFILPTPVYKFYEHLTSRYSDELDWGTLRKDGSDEPPPEEVREPIPVLAGIQDEIGESLALRRQDVESMLRDPKWYAVPKLWFSPSSRNWFERLVFWKFCEKDDLEQFAEAHADAAAEMHLEFIQNGMPAGYCIIAVQGEDICSSEPIKRLYLRQPDIRVALVENISNHPFEIDDFRARESQVSTIRSFKEDQTNIGNIPEGPTAYFAHRILAPGEKVIIPIQFVLAFDQQERQALEDALAKEVPGALLKALQGKTLSLRLGKEILHISGEDLAKKIETIDRNELKALLEREYIVGPSMQLTAVSIGGIKYPANSLQEDAVFIRSGEEGGSCPFLFIFSPATQQWRKWRHVLYKASTPGRSRREVLRVPIVGDAIMLKELEAETTFIRNIALIVETANGQRLEFLPDQQHAQSQKYALVLKQGESAIVKFDGNIPQGKTSLSIEGYYTRESTTYGRMARLGQKTWKTMTKRAVRMRE
jgi:hypothetical protein